MAYVEWHGTVPNHFKTKRLMRLLGCGKAQAVGYLGCLVAWAIENRPGGEFDRRLVPEGCEFEGADPEGFIVAMLDAGWIDALDENTVGIHDWIEVTKGYRRARKEARRLKNKRRKVTAARCATVAQALASVAPNRTDKNRTTRTTGTEQPAAAPSASAVDDHGGDGGDASGAAVAVATTAGEDGEGREDPMLGHISIKRGAELLGTLGIANGLASSFASERPVGEILDLVVHARTRKSPAGHARRAIEKGWASPRYDGPEVRELLEKLRIDEAALEAKAVHLTGGFTAPIGGGQKIPRLPEESNEDWLRRIMTTRKGVTA